MKKIIFKKSKHSTMKKQNSKEDRLLRRLSGVI
jgi:hypothetical protein